jgi:protein arginine kinase
MSNWYLQNGKESDVVVSTRVRLARNLKGFKFENKCTNEEKKKILSLIEDKCGEIGYGLKLMKLSDMDEVTKMALVEKHIISPEFSKIENENTAILINKEENICIMINGEDHLNIQLFSEGLAIEELKNLAIEIDEKIEKVLGYAFNEKYGYLTACPINLGTGMKISTMVHLPALSQTRNIGKILRIINNFGMTAKNVYGESLENNGDIYQISNNQTLGFSEDEIAKNVQTITDKVIEQERIARKYLGKTGLDLENRVYRSFGLMQYSRKISYDECLTLLSDIKLGTDMGIIKELDDSKVKKLCLYTKPANMQKYLGQIVEDDEADVKRAEVIKGILNS